MDEPTDEPTSRTERRRQSQRHTRQRGAGAVAIVLLVVGAGVLGWLAFRNDASATPKRKVAAATTTTTTTPQPAAPPPAVTAIQAVPEIHALEQPVDGATEVAKLTASTDYGFYRSFLVTDQSSHPGWLQVLLPIRPNDSSGWIKASDVRLQTTPYSIQIQLAAHKVTLLNAGKPVLDSQAVIGTEKTPTPTGMFYVTDPVDLQSDPNGAYGAFAIGLSGYSNVLMSFNGGPGQIALHGTNHPEQVGQDLSNGCVRVPNDIVLQIAKQVPLGTPVTITA